MGHPRLSEEVQVRHSHPEGRDRFGPRTPEEAALLVTDEDMEVVKSSHNMFRDFGLEHPGLEQLRAELASEIMRVLRERDLTVRAAEALTGVPAADFSRIRKPSLDRFTVDRLAKILWKLGVDFDATLATGPRADPPAR